MAKPRVFVSSTYYDLRHIRSSLERFIDELGFEPVLSERGAIPYLPDSPLDESCYRDAVLADILVLIIGGRYGSAASDSSKSSDGYYDSITRKEFDAAYDRGIPIYIVIESAVLSEYKTFLLNEEKDTNYAHVDDINIFKFIDHLHKKPLNNPILGFDRSRDIETWLREQWSGLFRELLRTRRTSKEAVDISSRIQELKSLNDTLKSYLETLLRESDPALAATVIEEESAKLKVLAKENALKENLFYKHMVSSYGLDDKKIIDLVSLDEESFNRKNVLKKLGKKTGEMFLEILEGYRLGRQEINSIRHTLGLSPLEYLNIEIKGTDGPES